MPTSESSIWVDEEDAGKMQLVAMFKTLSPQLLTETRSEDTSSSPVGHVAIAEMFQLLGIKSTESNSSSGAFELVYNFFL